MTKTLITAAFLMSILSGCQSGATLVRKDGASGRVALQGAYMPSMAEARLLMVDHCHGRYEMVELGDSVEFRCGKRSASAMNARVAIANVASVHSARGL